MRQKITLPVIVVLFLLIVFILMTFSGIIGNKTIANETILLPPGGEKTYHLPPGYVSITIIKTDVPLNINETGFGFKGIANGVTGGHEGLGTLFGIEYTITNPGSTDTNVSLDIRRGS